jgi:hypothetical protein
MLKAPDQAADIMDSIAASSGILAPFPKCSSDETNIDINPNQYQLFSLHNYFKYVAIFP